MSIIKKILFLIDALTGGGAERVLIDLVNSLDKNKFDITVMALADVGEFKNQLNSNIKYKALYKNKLIYLAVMVMNSKMLYKMFIKEKYDIEVSFLEGRSTKVIAGSSNKKSMKFAWVHVDFMILHWTRKNFLSVNQERECYKKYNSIVCVSNGVKQSFTNKFGIKDNLITQYNPINGNSIIEKSVEVIEDYQFEDCFTIVSVGRLNPVKGFDRLIEVANLLNKDGYKFRILIIGMGPEYDNLNAIIDKYNLNNIVKLLGFRENPYKYIKRSDLVVISSKNEGLSTVVIEGLILHIPVVTTDCAGMNEILGDNEYGIITHNSAEDLYRGIKSVLDDKKKYNYYKERAKQRSDYFVLKNSIEQIENMFNSEE